MERIGIFGIGNVGKALCSRLSGSLLAKDVYLYGKNDAEILGLVQDLEDARFLLGGPLFHKGRYEDIALLDYVVITAGVTPKVQEGGDRNTGSQDAYKIIEDIANRLKKSSYSKDILVATNPLDVMTYAMKVLLPQCTVYGTGTLLESARLGSYLVDKRKAALETVFPLAVGEHGPHTVLLSQMTRIGDHLLSEEEKDFQHLALEHVKSRGTDIAKLRRCTTEGIAASILVILQARDGEEDAVLPLSYPSLREKIAISRPCLIAKDTISPLVEEEDWTEEEKDQFEIAKKEIRKNIEKIPELLRKEKEKEE